MSESAAAASKPGVSPPAPRVESVVLRAARDADVGVLALAAALLLVGLVVRRAHGERMTTLAVGGATLQYPLGWIAGDPAVSGTTRRIEISDTLGGGHGGLVPRITVTTRDGLPARYADLLAANVELDAAQGHALYKRLSTGPYPVPGAGVSGVRLDFAYAARSGPDDLPVVGRAAEVAFVEPGAGRVVDVRVETTFDDWARRGPLFERVLASIEPAPGASAGGRP